MELGATLYLKKPDENEELLSRVPKVSGNIPPAGAHPVPPGNGSILEHVQL